MPRVGRLGKAVRRRVSRLLDDLRGSSRAIAEPTGHGGEWLRPVDLKELLRCAGPTILEIGANDGEHTLWFLSTFLEPRVYCFEPEPRAAARFKRKVGTHPNVQLYEVAIGEADGEAIFYRSDGVAEDPSFPRPESGWDFSGSLRRPQGHLVRYPWVKFQETIVVPRRALDSWAAENRIEDVDLVWMDVQGAELDVIRGASSTLARTKYLFTEYSDEELYEGQVGFGEILRALPQFRVLRRFSEDVLLQNVELLGTSASGGERS